MAAQPLELLAQPPPVFEPAAQGRLLRHHVVLEPVPEAPLVVGLLDVGSPVDNDVAQIREHLGRTVPGRAEPEELGRPIDECGRRLAGHERRVIDDVQQKRDVGLDAANPELPERPIRTPRRFVERRAPGRHLHEQRVEERRDHCPAEPVAAVEPHGKAARRPVGRDAAGVWEEMAVRVLGGDAALYCHPAALDGVLPWDVERGRMQLVAGGDQDLAAHQVHSSHHLGHGVLDLNTRIHLDEEELLPINVEQELHRAGIAVCDRPAQPDGRVADPRPQRVGDADRRGELDDLLVAPLDRAVALPEMHEVAVRVAEDLHLDVLRVGNVALEKHLGAPKRRGRLALGVRQARQELGFGGHHPHPAAAAPEAGLHDQGVPDARRDRGRPTEVIERPVRTRHRRHAGDPGQVLGGGLVAERLELLRRGTDKLNSRCVARPRQGRVFRQEPVPGMDGIHLVGERNGHHLVDTEVRTDGLATFGRPDQECLVGLEPMQGETVFVAIDRHGPQPKLGRRAKTADRDLRPVGDEQRPHRGSSASLLSCPGAREDPVHAVVALVAGVFVQLLVRLRHRDRGGPGPRPDRGIVHREFVQQRVGVNPRKTFDEA